MDTSIISRLKRRPCHLALYIGILTLVVLAVNAYGMIAFGSDIVLPHLFYIPIIFATYFFPRRGVLFTTGLSLTYFLMAMLLLPPSITDAVLSAGRIVVFLFIATVVSLLTLKLQESESQFRGVAERCSDIIFLTNPEGKATYVSPSYAKTLGMLPSDIIGKGPESFVHEEDMELLRNNTPNPKPGSVMSVTVRTRKKDGDYLLIEYHATPLITNGTFAGWQVIGRDVTKRQMAEEASREEGRRMAEIIDFLPDPTLVTDRDGMVVAWNKAMETMSLLPASAVIGRGEEVYTSWIRDSYHPVLVHYVLRRDIEAIREVYPAPHFEGNLVRTETEIVRTDGTRFSLWVSAIPLIGEDGEVTGAIESLRDVTHQKKIERALRESTRYLDSIINTIADPLFIKDRNHRFITVNDSFCQFTGYSRENLIGKTDHDVFRKDEADIYLEMDRAVFRTGLENENEEPLTDLQGRTHTITTKKTLYTNDAGEEFIVGIIRDISERKKMEQALHLTLKKLNMLSSITRHDILNQLMGLRAFIELTSGGDMDPEKAEFLKKADNAAEAIQRQIEFTRHYQDLGVKEPRWQDVETLFHAAAADLPLKGIDVDVRTRGVSVYADPLITTVFYNLMENSLRHGGKITAISLSAEEGPDGMTLVYRDNGVGIADADREYLFQRGFGKNTGLGLFLSREILSITGITITENGEEGKGARFEIRVPNGTYRIAGTE